MNLLYFLRSKFRIRHRIERIFPKFTFLDEECGIFADRGFRLWFAANPEVYNRLNSLLQKIVGVDESFIDCGANYGWVSVPLAARIKRANGKGKVIAIEADRKTANLLRKSIEKNSLSNQIILEKTFVSEKEGLVEFYSCTASGMSGGYFNDHIRDSIEKHGESLFVRKIQSTSIDALVNYHDIKNVAAVKVDIEGSELPTLKGCIKLMEVKQEIVFIVELNSITSSAAGYSIKDIWDFLKENRFNIFTFDTGSSDSLIRCPEFDEEFLLSSGDIVAVINETFLYNKLGPKLNW
jgi:FkbM family methyltransferase